LAEPTHGIDLFAARRGGHENMIGLPLKDVWHILQDEHAYIYHYTKAKTLVEHVLPTNRLRFSRFADVNDPRESKSWRFNIRNPSTSFDADNRVVVEFNRLLKRDWYVGCFSRDVNEAVATRARELAGANVVAAPLERGHSHPRMWAQYAEGYDGVCMVFDRRELADRVRVAAKPRTVFEGPIAYENPGFTRLDRSDALMIDMREVQQYGVEDAAIRHLERFHRELLFVKSKDWEAEREYRFVVAATSEPFFHIDYGKSLRGILLGDKLAPASVKAIAQYCLNNDVHIAELDWSQS
jgi:hypothetical protein